MSRGFLFVVTMLVCSFTFLLSLTVQGKDLAIGVWGKAEENNLCPFS